MSNQANQLAKGLVTLMAVYSGAKVYKIEIDDDAVKTRADLEPYLIEAGINYANSDMIVQPGELGLPSPESTVVIPEAREMTYNNELRQVRAFALFLSPKKNDSGMDIDISNAEGSWVRSEAKRLYKSGPEGKDHFTKDGKPYNSVSTDDLRDLLKSWYSLQTTDASSKLNSQNPEEGEQQRSYETEADVLQATVDSVEDAFQILILTHSALEEAYRNKVELVCETQSYKDIPDMLTGLTNVHSALEGFTNQAKEDIKMCREEIERRKSVKEAATATQQPSVASLDDMFGGFQKKYDARYRKR